jgi:hypothetical protein
MTFTALDPAAARLLDFTLGSISSSGPAQPHAAYEVQCDEAAGKFWLKSRSHPEEQHVPGSAAHTAVQLMDRACFHLADRSSGGLLLHGALVNWQGQGVLLPASSGAGKSCLCAELVRRGADYLTDELVYIPLGGLEAFGLRRALTFKGSAGDVLTDMLGGLEGRTDVLRDHSHILLAPSALRPGASSVESIRIERIIFPVYQKDAPYLLQPLTPAQTGLALMQCLINARNLSEHGFPEIARLARQVRAVQVQYGDFGWIEALAAPLNDSGL